MKMTLKRENDKFSTMTLKPLSGPICLINRPKTPKLWAITHENDSKRENDKFSAMTLKPLSGPIGLGNGPRSPNLWAITHENCPKTRKRQVFSHDSQPCFRSNKPCKSPYNPKTMGYSS